MYYSEELGQKIKASQTCKILKTPETLIITLNRVNYQLGTDAG